MAEILFRIRRQEIARDIYQQAQLTQAGDAISVLPDRSTWGSHERESVDHRLIRVVGLPMSEANALLATELPTDPRFPSRTLQKRAFRLDISQLSAIRDASAWLADDTRQIPILIVSDPADVALFRAAKQQKPPIQDPAVIGREPGVIG